MPLLSPKKLNDASHRPQTIKALNLVAVVSICGSKTRLFYGPLTLIQPKPEQRGEGSPKASLYPHPNWRKFEKPLRKRVSYLRLFRTLGTPVLHGKKTV